MATMLRNYIGGEWVPSSATEFLEITNPATGESLGCVPLSGAREVDQAVTAAQEAFLQWREVPPVVRARYLFKLKTLLEQHEAGHLLLHPGHDVGVGVADAEGEKASSPFGPIPTRAVAVSPGSACTMITSTHALFDGHCRRSA